MINKIYNAVVERNVTWTGDFATEPYECGWAREAIFFVRSLKGGSTAQCKVQVSADGMHWCDEGSVFDLPRKDHESTWCRVKHFGNWLRITGTTNDDTITVLVTLSMKS